MNKTRLAAPGRAFQQNRQLIAIRGGKYFDFAPTGLVVGLVFDQALSSAARGFQARDPLSELQRAEAPPRRIIDRTGAMLARVRAVAAVTLVGTRDLVIMRAVACAGDSTHDLPYLSTLYAAGTARD